MTNKMLVISVIVWSTWMPQHLVVIGIICRSLLNDNAAIVLYSLTKYYAIFAEVKGCFGTFVSNNQPIGMIWSCSFQHPNDNRIVRLWQSNFESNNDWCIEINKLLNKLLQILLCTIWIDKGLFDCRVWSQQGRDGATGWTTKWLKPWSGLSLWYQSNRTLGSIGKPVTG